MSLITVIGLLLAYVPVAAGASATVVHKAPYTGSAFSPNVYLSYTGCSVSHVLTPKWAPTSGLATTMSSASAHTCRPFGTVGGGLAQGSAAITVGIPLRVTTPGTHSIGSNWTLALASTQTFTAGNCPPKNINYNLSLYQSAYSGCGSLAGLSVDVYAILVDLSNSSWYKANVSHGTFGNLSGWENFTSCYNSAGVPSCSTTVGPIGYSYWYQYNAPGFAPTFNGNDTFTLWNNGSSMVPHHHYFLEVTITLLNSAEAVNENLKSLWAASASAILNMANPGNGAKLNWVSVT